MDGQTLFEREPGYRKLIAVAHRNPDFIRKQIAAELCARPGGLFRFVQLMWKFVEPDRKFIPGWHIEAICEHLEAVTRGEITRLLINVPPGFCKPVATSAIVQLSSGDRVSLGKIHVGDRIITKTGKPATVVEIHEQGELECLAIRTWSGREVVAAPDHPFLTPEGWVQAKDLVVGQCLALRANREYEETRLMILDRRRDEEFALAGYLIGDGSVTGNAANVTSGTPIHIEQVCALAAALGFTANPVQHQTNDVDLYRIELSGGVRRWIRDIGIAGMSSATKRVPGFVFRGTDQQVALFLAAYFQCDGTIVKKSPERKNFLISFASISKGLLEDVAHLMLRLGIRARLRRRVTKKDGAYVKAGYVSYNLDVGREDDAARFSVRIPLIGPKHERLAEYQAFRKTFEVPLLADEITEIEEVGLQECRCLSIEGEHSFLANDFVVHNSLLSSVFFPAFEWGPKGLASMRYMCVSYSQQLTVRDNVRFRQIITSDLYRELWGGHVQPSKVQFSLEQVSNTRTGFKLASSVGGVGTGARADRIILDDPNSVKDVESDAIRASTNQYFAEVLPTRLNSPSESAIIVIQQRAHEEDVSGLILSKELDYEHLLIPMEWDGRDYTTSIGWRDPRAERGIDGELAWPAMWPRKAVNSAKAAMTEFSVAGQFQQTPVPRGGAIFETAWWLPWPPIGDAEQAAKWITKDGKIQYPPFEYLVCAVDTAFTEKQENDASACVVWGVFRTASGEATMMRGSVEDPATMIRVASEERPKAMLVFAWQKRVTLHGTTEERPPGITDREWTSREWRERRQRNWGLVEWVIDTCRRYKVDRLIIEQQGRGHDLQQELLRLHSSGDWTIELKHAQGDKRERAYAVQQLFSNGRIFAPQYPDGSRPQWCQMVIDQFASFPRGSHDDIVDSGVYGLLHLRNAGILIRSEEYDEEITEELSRLPGGPAPLYDV